jgi:hypothetical protein
MRQKLLKDKRSPGSMKIEPGLFVFGPDFLVVDISI